ERRKIIEVGTNIGDLALHLGVERGRILVRADDIGDAGEDKTERVLKVFDLELPDTVHENVAGAQRGANQAAGLGSLNEDAIADIADEHAIEGPFLGKQRRQPAEHAYAEVVEDAAVRVRLAPELAAAGADVAPRQFQGGE